MWQWANYGRDKLCLVGCLGSEPRLAQSQTWGIRLLSRRLGEPAAPGGECGPCREFASYTLAFALQLRKITDLSQGSRKALGWSAPNMIRLVDWAIKGDGLDWPAGPCRPWLSRQATGSTLGQSKYLPSCRTRELPSSAHFESKPAVSALMWSANRRTPRFSCICLLLTYQGAPIARRRHLDCNTCSLRTWVPSADLHAGQALSIMGRMSCLCSCTPFLTDRSLILFRGEPSISHLWAVFFLTCSIWCEQVSRISKVTLIYRVVSTDWIGSLKSVTGRGRMKRRPALANIIVVLLYTLMAILHSLNHRYW